MSDRDASDKATNLNAQFGDYAQGNAVGPNAQTNNYFISPAAPTLPPITDLSDQQVLAACERASALAFPAHWGDGRSAVARPQLDKALAQYLAAPEPVFALTGSSNIGKSWGTARWIVAGPHGGAGLLIPGSNLDHIDHNHPLPWLIEEALHAHLPYPWPGHLIINRLTALVSFVLVIDDLRPPSANVDAYRRDLERLANDCMSEGVKLVFTCSRQLWDYYNLGKYISQHLYKPPVGAPPSRPARQLPSRQEADENQPSQSNPSLMASDGSTHAYSFMLEGLTDDEIHEIVEQRLDAHVAKRVAPCLVQPAFQALRNPFLLQEYLNRFGRTLGDNPNAEPAPVDADTLLDGRVQTALERAADELPCSNRDLADGFELLLAQLWSSRTVRPSGIPYAVADDCFSPTLSGQSKEAIAQLRREGLLSAPPNDIQIAEPLVAARLFAQRLIGQLHQGEAVLSTLRPAEDADVVIALLRACFALPKDAGPTDPVRIAQGLLALNREWLPAVTQGLAQGGPDDYRAIALLSALARPTTRSIVGGEACDALGQLAVRGGAARKWVAGMYLNPRTRERFRGNRALSQAMRYDHRWGEAAIRLRLEKGRAIEDARAQRRWLQGALDPLLYLDDAASSRVSQAIIDRYERTFGADYRGLDEDEQVDVHAARGQLAVLRGDSDIQAVLADMRSPDPKVRYKAACALRPIAFERPELAKAAILVAIETEEDDRVLNRILWAVYPISQIAPDELLETLRNSRAVDWARPSNVTGQAFSILGNLASDFPEQVAAVLPNKLDAYAPWVRALQSEMLAYAWWRVAERVPEARRQLEALARPDLARVEEQIRIFGLKGAATAQLALICLGTIPADSLDGLIIPYDSSDLVVLTLSTDDFARQNARFITEHPEYPKLQRLLLRCAREEARVNSDLRDPFAREARFESAYTCLEMLISFASVLPKPQSILAGLPRGDMALDVTYSLLVTEGRTDQTVTEYVRALVGSLTDEGGTTNAIFERQTCRYHLALMDKGLDAALQEHGDVHRFLRNDPEGGEYLAHIMAMQPGQTLQLLDRNICEPRDLALFHHLVDETRTWQSVLVSNVYARMLSLRPISVREARELCRQIMVALSGLPTSPLKADYEAVYGVINRWLDGRPESPSATLTETRSAIGQSHALALALLQDAFRRQLHGEAVTATWAASTLYSSDGGWWETDNFKIENGYVVGGFGPSHYVMYMFPAVRLALVAVGQQYRLGDLGALFMNQRLQVHRLYQNNISLFQHPEWFSPDLAEGRSEVEALLTHIDDMKRRAPQDERLWAWEGYLRLILGELPLATQALEHSLSLPRCQGDTRAGVLYNLACVCARSGNNNDCRQYLEASLQLRRCFGYEVEGDADFQSVKDLPWFSELLGKYCK